MNAAELAVRAHTPPRSACAIACDLWGASSQLVELADRIVAGAKVSPDVDAIARGLQAIAAELRNAQGGGDAA
jgi:hypothetical protein